MGDEQSKELVEEDTKEVDENNEIINALGEDIWVQETSKFTIQEIKDW